MNEYLFLYRNTDEAHRGAMGSPELAQKSMGKWRAWMEQLEKKGHLKSVGQPLERTGKVVGGKKRAITDGPYAETKDIIGGYSVVLAKDIEQAAQFAEGCPVIEGGGYVEVRPVKKMDL